MKESYYKIIDKILKWGLYLWRIFLWIAVAIIVVLSWFDQLSKEVIFTVCYIVIFVLIIKSVNYIKKSIETTQRDLQIIKKKLGLKKRTMDDGERMGERISYVSRRVLGGISFLEMREYYISKFGYRRWLTDGRELTESFFKEQNIDKKGNPELWKETFEEIVKELSKDYENE